LLAISEDRLIKSTKRYQDERFIVDE